MALTFTRALTVKPGEPISSRHLASLAAAFNDRLRSGLGDGAWRIAWYLFGLFRSIRNPNADFTLYPPTNEFFEIYQHLQATDAQWPVSFAGDPEGVNVSNPLGAFVFGNESANFLGESDALSVELQVPDGLGGTKVPETATEIWELRKKQIGARDPNTGAQAAPMLDGARNFLRLVYSPYSTYGNSYGGWLPVPEIGSGCASGASPEPPNYLYRFTATSTSVGDPGAHNATTTTTADGLLEVTYDGSCPEQPNHVGYIMRLADYFVVYFNDGVTVDILSRRDWVEGPYTGGGSMRHASGGQIGLVLGQYSSEFRGTDSQKQDEYDKKAPWNHKAFKAREFIGTQYRLSPQRGTQLDAATITQHFKKFRNVASTNQRYSGLVGAYGTPDFVHQYDTGYVFTAAHVSASSVSGSFTLTFVSIDDDGNETEIESKTFTATDGSVDEIWLIASPLTPGALGVRVDDIRYTDLDGLLDIEPDELFPYKPSTHDAAAMLRLLTAPNGDGLNEEDVPTVSACYFEKGTLYNSATEALPFLDTYINDSPTYEAARRLSKCVRILNGDNLVGYEVVDGKSVLYFKRYGAEPFTGFSFDKFDGIAPTTDNVESGSLVPGRVYKVKSHPIEYNGRIYAVGATVTAQPGLLTYAGAGGLYETDGIYHTAPPKGLSNEWVMTADLKGFFWSDSSIWKLDAYGRYITFSDRCMFYYKDARGLGLPGDMLLQYSQGVSGAYSPEAPSGWRYAEGVNDIDCSGDPTCEANRDDFYASCQLYQPPVEIESAEDYTLSDGTPCVKLTLTDRLPSATGAPSSVALDTSTWDRANLYTTQSYRTLENAIMEWLLWQNAGVAPSVKTGDHSFHSDIDTVPDKPWGSVYPHFMFVQLVQSPYLDDNSKPDASDTPFSADHWRQVWMYTRAMCEGFVDGTTSAAYSCTLGVTSAYDYAFGNLMFDAMRKPWAMTAPSVQTSGLQPLDVRDDVPEGYGPVATLRASSETFNQFSNAVNLLTRVRVPLPSKFQTRTDTGDNELLTTAQDATGADVPCSTSATARGIVHNTPAAGTITATGSWVDASDATAIQLARVKIPYCPGGRAEWTLLTTREDVAYQWQPTLTEATAACPESWRDMLGTYGEFLCTYSSRRVVPVAKIVTDGSGTPCCAPTDPRPCPEFWTDGHGGAYQFAQAEELETVCKIMPAVGTLTANNPPGGVFEAGVMPSPEYCAGESSEQIVITPALADALILNVPLSDFTDESSG